ncbi:MAG: divalent-cation tolerance protein CutA [Candidatus Hodarchaeales archaeon]|jgi:periplasmic divalent cation tolerance protein
MMYVAIYSTFASLSDAKKLAHQLVEKKLVACVNLIPKVTSIYRWNNQVQEEEEVIFWCKTQEEHVEPIQDIFDQYHPYELPAFSVYPIHTGSAKYLQWISEETKT